MNALDLFRQTLATRKPTPKDVRHVTPELGLGTLQNQEHLPFARVGRHFGRSILARQGVADRPGVAFEHVHAREGRDIRTRQQVLL